MKNKKKVVCAMSGGVDSSVVASLLKDKFEVVGIYLRLNKFSQEEENRAKKVAKLLNIPFKVVNAEKEFKLKVVEYFLKENKRGLTPNPCVVCNKEIKFGLLLKESLKLGADYLATGHYVKSSVVGDKVKLYRGKDKEKDQSYFLWQLNQKQLSKVLFSLGNYTRGEVEELAKKYGLPIVKNSQEICFINNKLECFLKDNFKENVGNIVDTKGKVVGQHLGLYFYTIGQRKGIGLSGGPYWVLDKDLKKNVLIVTKSEKDLLKKELIANKLNWILGESPKLPLKVKVKIRYNQPLFSGELSWVDKNKVKVVFTKGQRAITSGQSIVFYKGSEVLGGGIIIKQN